MPELPNYLYEQLSYHKILPLEYNLSMKILHLPLRLEQFVPSSGMELSVLAAPLPVQIGSSFAFPRVLVCDNFQTTVMSDHKVFCAKLKQELPGLPEPPFDTDLGNKIYEQISQRAWGEWTEYCKMLLNEYRLNPARKQDQEVIVKQMEQFFFGDGAAPPKEYVPPTH
jgi:Fe-S cluster biosynthesis and repair protein YggX